MKIVSGKISLFDQDETTVNFNKIYGSYVVTLSSDDNYNVCVKDKKPDSFKISASSKLTGEICWKIIVKE